MRIFSQNCIDPEQKNGPRHRGFKHAMQYGTHPSCFSEWIPSIPCWHALPGDGTHLWHWAAEGVLALQRGRPTLCLDPRIPSARRGCPELWLGAALYSFSVQGSAFAVNRVSNAWLPAATASHLPVTRLPLQRLANSWPKVRSAGAFLAIR